MRKILCLGLVAGLAQGAAAQQFGGNPPSLKWQQINTDTVRVIFPRGLEAQGRRVADVTSFISRYHRASIGPMQRKISIVLQTQTMQSNGYVQLAPFRSEFYLTPPPATSSVGSLNWLDQLAIHEYRHVLQNANFRKGLSKAGSIVFGQLGQAALTNIAVPDWFWEGDAVVTETALSTQGRGRLPAFFDGFRALELAGKDYSYMRIRNGSYRRFTPDHYATGYLMTSYGRLQHGVDFWKGVTDDAVRYRRLFYPFSQSLKHRTGKNAAAFFRAALGSYSANWPKTSAQPADTLTPMTGAVTNYKFVYPAEDKGWIVSKSDYKHITAFFHIDAQGKETRIAAPGIGFDDYFHYRNGRLAWTEARFDARWGWRDYSIVKVLDRHTGATHTLRHERRCFSPSFSPDGNTLAVVAVTEAQTYRLEVLDATTGAIRQTLPNPENWYYTYPQFTPDGSALVSAVRDGAGRMGLIRQSLADGQVAVLVPFAVRSLGQTVVDGQTAYFTAGYGDADNIFAVPLAGGDVKQLTQRPNGVNHLAVSGDRLVYSEFTAEGYKLLSSPVAPASISARNAWLQPDFGEGGDILDKVPARNLEARKYAKTTGFFNFHSWLPRIDDPDYGWYLYGENVLANTQTILGASWNTNENSPEVSADFIYGGWFPLLRGGADYRAQRKLDVNDTIRVEWNELDAYAGLSIPLNLSGGKYYRYLTGGADYHVVTRTRSGDSKYRFRDDNIQYVDASLAFSNSRLRARQHIFSHFAQSLSLRYRRAVNGVPAEQFTGGLSLYLPGAAPTHSLVLQGAYQQRDTMFRYAFTDNFVYARGYEKPPLYKHIYKLGANYHFPLWYPDWGFANLLYFMRVRANVFYDYSAARNYRQVRDVTYASVGGELFADTKLGNVLPFSFGVRYSRLLNDDPIDPSRTGRFEFILPLQQLFAN
ncbi:hypothetical protein ACWKWU_22685 [Chitinophaga lutea]